MDEFKQRKFSGNLHTEIVKERFEIYIKNSNHLSCSTAKKYKKSPLHKEKEIQKETEALRISSMYHDYILENHLFWEYYYSLDETEILEELSIKYTNPRNTNRYREWYAIESAKSGNKTFATPKEIDNLKAMRKELLKYPFINYLLNNSEKEVSAYGQFDGVPVKGRFDMINYKRRWIADLKGLVDASEKGIKKYLVDYDGHLQPALYTHLAQNLTADDSPWTFYWIAQEKVPPFAVGIYKASIQVINVGLHELGLLVEQHRYCEETGDFAGYEVFIDNEFGIKEIDLPAYAIKDYSFYNR